MNYSMSWKGWYISYSNDVNFNLYLEPGKTITGTKYILKEDKDCASPFQVAIILWELSSPALEKVSCWEDWENIVLRVLATTNFKSSTVLELEFFNMFDNGPLL